MAITAAELQTRLELNRADKARYQRDMGSIDDKTTKTGHHIGTAMKVAGAAFAAVGIGAAIGAKKAIDAASNLGESVNAVEVVFGKASDTIFEFGKTAATQAGLSQRAFNEAVTPIGAALRNVGLGAEEAANQSINLTKRAADMASVFNVDLDEAITAIQAGLRGEADPLERFGVGLNETAIASYAVKTGIAAAGEEMTNQQKVQARLGLLMEQSNRVAGDFVNTSDGLANQQRILRAEFENVSAEVGTALLPVATKLLGIVADLVPKVLDLGRSIAGFLGPVLSTVVDTVRDFAEGLGGSGEGSVAGAGWKVSQFIRGQLIPALKGIWGWISDNIIPIIRDLGKIVVRTFHAFAKVIDDNRPALDRIYDRIKRVLNLLGDVWHIIWIVLKPVLILVFQYILPRVLGIVITYIDKVSGAIEKVIGWFVKAKDKAKDVWGSITNFIGNAWDKAKLFRDALVDMIDRVMGPLRTLSDIVKGVAGFFGSAARAVGGINGDGIVSSLSVGAGGAGAPQRTIVSSLWDDIAIGQGMGLGISSGYRPGAITSTGNPSLHGMFPSHAVDMSGSTEAMRRFFALEVARAGATGLAEVIHSPYWWHPGVGVSRIPASAGSVLADHYNHVHVGTYDQGGYLRPGWNLAYNGLGRPEPVGAGNTYNFNGPVLDGEKLLRFIRDQEAKHQRRGGMS